MYEFVLGMVFGNDPFNTVAAAMGVLFGILFVFNGWAGDTSDVELKESPRVKNALWALGGLLVTLVADWGELLGKDEFDKTLFVPNYVVYFIATTVLLLVTVTVYVFFKHRRNAEASGVRGAYSGLTAIGDYLHYGFTYCEAAAARALEAEQQRILRTYKDIFSKAAFQIGPHIAAVERVRKQASAEETMAQANQILDSVGEIFSLYGSAERQITAYANLMLAIPLEGAPDDQIRAILFSPDPEKRYSHVLIPYGRGQIGDNAKLPVMEERAADYSLPGASRAFLLGEPQIVDTRNPDIDPRIAKDVTAEISSYFAERFYSTVISVPVPDADGKTIGVMNINSNLHDAVDEIDDLAANMVDTMTPFVILIGLLLGPAK